MPISTDFLNTCRTSIIAQPEYTAFNTAHAAYVSASRASKPVYWVAAYDNAQAGQSPAYRLHAAIRSVVTSQAAISGGLSDGERETAIQTLAAEYIPNTKRPRDAVQEAAELDKLIREDRVS